MHRHYPPFLFAALSLAPALHAEEASVAAEQPATLEQRLAESERHRNELAVQLQSASSDSAQLARLRQENQRLKQQLHDVQTRQPERLLNEEQTWYVTGAATALLAFMLGALSRGRRRQRREWLN
ncbi:translation initiation factor 2 (IF-2, GTPase) [Pseudomonas schmalbachii]|uniref:Translation initiation factor 2 (IF-2, GTPase) n=1 Tax=Pseudomonas schmalbachii TaxID=2816993 RepID=A0ABS3TL52_9PSED|nr:translation initiation factor 2 (IF-2, GTPase) [Pseudomonas schmalbachii]MBO3274385.1 translation initiation factor 2 (IF-2, GTPase) [Pseudomonas schmalbachii]